MTCTADLRYTLAQKSSSVKCRLHIKKILFKAANLHERSCSYKRHETLLQSATGFDPTCFFVHHSFLRVISLSTILSTKTAPTNSESVSLCLQNHAAPTYQHHNASTVHHSGARLAAKSCLFFENHNPAVYADCSRAKKSHICHTEISTMPRNNCYNT